MSLKSFYYLLTATQEELLQLIDDLNQDNTVDGILVQLPLPKGLDEQEVIARINPAKDVDGFHPVNVGKLYIGLDTFLPCTPAGIMEMLKEINYDISGKKAVVLGRSNICWKTYRSIIITI